MTEPIEEAPTRRIATINLAGHEFTVKELTDVQIMHLGRHARILVSDRVSNEAKMEASDRMLSILHNCVDPEQLPFLVGLEEEGAVTLQGLTAMARAFQANDEPQPVVRRRGRPRKSA